MNAHEQIAFELRARCGVLPSELSRVKELADKNQNGWGIHQSQINRVKESLDALQKNLEEVLNTLDASLAPDQFSPKRSEIQLTLVRTHSVMAVFNYIFAQRDRSAEDKFVLDIADIIVAKCYLPCIQLANQWRGINKDHFREPPLIFFNAMLSPAALNRSYTVSKVGLEMYAEVEHLLPISVISLPFHDQAALWTYCSLYHEVGHLLDHDIGLCGDFKKLLDTSLSESRVKDHWELWLREIIADAFGILLGGAGFAYALFNMILNSPKDVRQAPADKHPIDYVRMFLLCALLRKTKVTALVDAAAEIEKSWIGLYGDPAELTVYIDECEQVANLILRGELAIVNGHTLIELAPLLETDHESTLKLSWWLRDVDERPDPIAFPLQLVPAATQLAAHDVNNEFATEYQGIQKRAIEYLTQIKPPKFLDPSLESSEHLSYVRGMLENLKLT